MSISHLGTSAILKIIETDDPELLALKDESGEIICFLTPEEAIGLFAKGINVPETIELQWYRCEFLNDKQSSYRETNFTPRT